MMKNDIIPAIIVQNGVLNVGKNLQRIEKNTAVATSVVAQWLTIKTPLERLVATAKNTPKINQVNKLAPKIEIIAVMFIY